MPDYLKYEDIKVKGDPAIPHGLPPYNLRETVDGGETLIPRETLFPVPPGTQDTTGTQLDLGHAVRTAPGALAPRPDLTEKLGKGTGLWFPSSGSPGPAAFPIDLSKVEPTERPGYTALTPNMWYPTSDVPQHLRRIPAAEQNGGEIADNLLGGNNGDTPAGPGHVFEMDPDQMKKYATEHDDAATECRNLVGRHSGLPDQVLQRDGKVAWNFVQGLTQAISEWDNALNALANKLNDTGSSTRSATVNVLATDQAAAAAFSTDVSPTGRA